MDKESVTPLLDMVKIAKEIGLEDSLNIAYGAWKKSVANNLVPSAANTPPIFKQDMKTSYTEEELEVPEIQNIAVNDGEYEDPSQTQDTPAIASMDTSIEPAVHQQTYSNKNGPDYVRKIEGDNVKWESEDSTRTIVDEVLAEDFDVMREETRNFNNKSSIAY